MPDLMLKQLFIYSKNDPICNVMPYDLNTIFIMFLKLIDLFILSRLFIIKPLIMKGNTSKRYTQETATELFKNALKLSSNGMYTNFTQLAKVQNVFRKTYLDQSRRYDGMEEVYRKIKSNLHRNILLQLESGMLSPSKANLMLWNHTRK